jgi:hypothetical protein
MTVLESVKAQGITSDTLLHQIQVDLIRGWTDDATERLEVFDKVVNALADVTADRDSWIQQCDTRITDCLDIAAKCDKLQKTLQVASKWAAETSGGCPADTYADDNWDHPLGCATYCDTIDNDASGCWLTYFTQEAEKG